MSLDLNTPLRWATFNALPNAGTIDYDDFYNPDTDAENLREAKVDCPSCGRTCSPLLSPTHKHQCNSERWANLDYKVYFSCYFATCPKCKTVYRFEITCSD